MARPDPAQGPFRKTITCPVMNRPDLFEMMLASLAMNDLNGWHMFVAVEPGDHQDAFAEICSRHLPDGGYTVTINPRRLGLRANLYHVVRRAFDQGAEVNLYLEEDLLLAPDVTTLADWFVANRQPHWLCLNLLAGACGNPGHMSHVAHPDLFFETDCFNSYGLVITPDAWARVRDAWLGPDPRVARNYDVARWTRTGRRHLLREGWDWAVWSEVLQDPALKVVQPVAARSTHIGVVGVHVRPPFQERAFGHISLSTSAPAAADYRVVPIGKLPDPARGHSELLNHAARLMAGLDQRAYPRKWPPARWVGALVTQIRGHPLDPKDRAR